MTCKYCNGIGWFLHKEDAPSPPYKANTKLEFAKECACRNEGNRPYQNNKSP